MVEPRLARTSFLLVAALGVGWLAVLSRPVGSLGSEMWPIGLTIAVLLGGRGRSAADTALLGLAVALVGGATFALGGRPWDFSLVGAGAILAESAVAAWILTDRGRRPPRLVDDADLSRFVRASAAGALLAGLIIGLGAWLLGEGRPLLTGLGTTAGHLSSALVLLPLLLPISAHSTIATVSERVMQWLVLVVVTVAAFTPTEFPSLVFVVMPVLAWTALRSSWHETQLQLLAVATLATLLTTFGFGPLAQRAGQYALPELVLSLVLQTFLITCALVAIPLAMAVGQQVSAIQRAERESDLLRRVIDSAHVAIIGTDPTGQINLFNPGAERLLGYTAEEVMGRSNHMFHSEQALSEKAAELGVAADFVTVVRTLAHPRHAGTQIKFLRKDGTERIHAMTLSQLHDTRGRLRGWVCTSADMTEEVTARQALLDALDTERRAVQRLQEVDQVKDTFVSSVSHELRTPITSIVGYLEMLLEGEFGELAGPQEVAVRRVDTNSKRLLSLIDELLTLSRVHEQQGGELVDLDLRGVVQTAYDVVSPAWAQRDLHTILELPSNPVSVAGHRELLERVVVNLLGNAVKFTPDGGSVSLTLVEDGTDAVVSVRDTGIGIPADEQQHLFTRFFRSSLAQHHAIQGSGLGLSIAHAVVRDHGGILEVESAPGEGSVFRVRVPLVRRMASAAARAGAVAD